MAYLCVLISGWKQKSRLLSSCGPRRRIDPLQSSSRGQELWRGSAGLQINKVNRCGGHAVRGVQPGIFGANEENSWWRVVSFWACINVSLITWSQDVRYGFTEPCFLAINRNQLLKETLQNGDFNLPPFHPLSIESKLPAPHHPFLLTILSLWFL